MGTTELAILIGVSVLAIGIFILIKKLSSSSGKMDSVIKLIDQKNYDQATRLLKTALQKSDSNSAAHYYLGLCYVKMNNLEWALPHFRKVIQINRYNNYVQEVDARERLADIYLHYQKLEEAQKEFLLILKLKPDDYQYYYRVGEIFYQRHYKDNAAAYFQKALEIRPSHVDSLFRMGEFHYMGKRPSEALNHMNKCLKLDSNYLKAHYYLGMVHLDSRNYLQAIQEFEKSVGDKEYRLRSFLQKGRALMDSGSSEKAIYEMERGVSYITDEDNTSFALRYLLASAYERQRDIPSAIAQWEIISNVKKDYRDVQSKLKEYHDIRMDDQLKDFMTASDDKFETICRKIITNLDLEVLELKASKGMIATIIATEHESQWRAQRRSKFLVKIYRINESVGEKLIREMQDQMKEAGMTKGYFLTSSDFMRQAIEFAETRPIELYDKNRLSSLMRKDKSSTQK